MAVWIRVKIALVSCSSEVQNEEKLEAIQRSVSLNFRERNTKESTGKCIIIRTTRGEYEFYVANGVRLSQGF